MKKFIFFSLLFALLGIASCDISDDEELCTTGPVLIMLDLVQEGSNANLFSNGTFQQSQLTVEDNNGQAVNHNFLNIDGRVFLRIALGETVGERSITLELDDNTSLGIEYTMAATTGNCSNPYISDFDIPGFDFDQSTTTGVIRVYFPNPGN